MATSVRKVSDMDADKVKFRGKGIAFTATAGASTSYDYKLTEGRLIDGTRLILKNHVFGDSVKFQVVDVDNILGYGAGVVLDEFADSWFVVEDRQDQHETRLPYSAEVIANLYLRIIYASVGGTNVLVQCNLFAHKYYA
jgi:hypothetical protein